MKIALCDDSINDLTTISLLMNEYYTSRNLDLEVYPYTNGLDLLNDIKNNKTYDVFYFDIIMPNINGMDLARRIKESNPFADIIFVSTSPDYALDSYSVHATNYLLKPINKTDLFNTLDDIFSKKVFVQPDFLVVKSKKGIAKFLLSNLIFAEVIGRNIFYTLINGQVIECLDLFTNVCDNLLKYNYFIRPHRSYIINMNYINILNNTQIILQNNVIIPIARGNLKTVKEHYLKHQFGE